MIIIKIKAGLGNQMFQYAFGRALSLERKESLFLDISYYNNQPKRDAKRDFILDNFNIKAKMLPDEASQKYNSWFKTLLKKILWRLKKTSVIDAYKYDPKLMRSKDTYFEGHWVNQKYFLKYREKIIEDFILKNPLREPAQKVLETILDCKVKNKTPVSLNIRRGDFVTNPQSAFNGILGVQHYQKAIGELTKMGTQNICVFVFSDDIGWAKENLKLPCEMQFVSNPNISDCEELMLLTNCLHNIIANSTFSWWGAWLNENPNKIVIAPYQWLKEKTAEELDLLPPEWIKI